MRRALALLALTSCASFEDPAIVLDLRIVAMTSSPPEQILDVDFEQMPQLGDLVDQLEPSFVCAHVADPGRTRALRWSMTACLPSVHENGDQLGVCDEERPQKLLVEAIADDPELVPTSLCGAVPNDGNLVAILLDAYENDLLRGFAGLDYIVVFKVGDFDADPALDLVGVKQLRVAARIPETRVANENPFLTELQLAVNEVAQDPAQLGHCANGSTITVRPGQRVLLFPLEAEGARQEYFVPTVDGTFKMFTETMSYQWLATGGSFNEHTTGGPTDILGNQPPPGSTWFAPAVDRATEFQLWALQRDERFGVSVYPTCITVRP